MWDYAMLTKAAKTVGGPAGLVLSLVAGGVVIGAAGLKTIQQLTASKKQAELPRMKNHPTTRRKSRSNHGLVRFRKQEEQARGTHR